MLQSYRLIVRTWTT